MFHIEQGGSSQCHRLVFGENKRAMMVKIKGMMNNEAVIVGETSNYDEKAWMVLTKPLWLWW